MNIHEYEVIVADPDRVRSGVLSMFYEASRRSTPWGTSMGPVRLEDIPANGIDLMERLFKAALSRAVDDYTTPGCSCDYCTGARPLIMCTRRWGKLPPEERIEIAESVAD